MEFKTCRNKINRGVYETVCAFLNRHGGTILLGVQDDGTLQGIEPDAVTQIKKDFVTSVNNPLKLTPPTYLSVDVVELDGKSLLRIYVPESSQVHRCNGRIYDRNEDGDLDITDHTAIWCTPISSKATTGFWLLSKSICPIPFILKALNAEVCGMPSSVKLHPTFLFTVNIPAAFLLGLSLNTVK